ARPPALPWVPAAGAPAEPVQSSATSQPPPAERQTVADDTKPSVGHALLAPSHASATSQIPADEPHTEPELPFASAGHAAAEPVQFSATSQTPPAERQTVADAVKT